MGIFRFKKFSVCDDRSAMKVGTDAVLLGAWSDVSGANRMLDIGTGCGVIALMLAQRNPSAIIDAVEIRKEDASEARQNAANSPWKQRVNVWEGSITEFQPDHQYDVIVCNPPFFLDSLLPPEESRQAVRHDVFLGHKELAVHVRRLLAQEGKLNMILPVPESGSFIKYAELSRLHLRRRTRFYSKPEKPAERMLMEFQFSKGEVQDNSLVLYSDNLLWSEEYRKLTADFYLKG